AGCQLPLVDVDSAELMRLMVVQALAAEIQVRILDAIRSGDLAAAQQLWETHCPGAAAPFRRSRFCTRFASFCSRLEAGACTPQEAVDMEREMLALGLAEHPCCGAPSLLEEIRECVLIGQRIGAARPGVQTQAAILPPGEIDLIYNPGVADGEAIVLDAGSVMLGTGGIGTMHVQHGNIAQQQGLPLGTGISVAEDDTKLVNTGFLIENTTQSPVNFVLANQQFELAPLTRQSYSAGPTEISFYTGASRQLARHSVKPGTLRFVVERGGFAVRAVTAFQATIDNSANDSPFHYIFQGADAVCPPRSKQSHESLYPLVFRFDRGNGSVTKQVVSRERQTVLAVGINPSDNLWDLFAPGDLPASRPVILPQGDTSDSVPLFLNL
ncbi:MAG TPA: hypothetical protein VFV87_17470, partial [Pirellulaceae bacterium]|nr:hypothetical protein [Pirellulaceae bacterium]